MAELTEDIKNRLSIVDVVSQYLQLKKAGRNFKSVCPFHNDKTPSLIVSPEKDIFHCFGCHKGGDIFTFVQEYEGVNFPEALQILADKAGIKINNIEKFYKKDKKDEKEIYYKVHELACEFFEKELWKGKESDKVLQYLYKRGLKDETIKEFRLGFAPDSFDTLYNYLLKKGVDKNILLKSGLASSKGIGDDRIYDKYRGRLIFPIFDYLGKVCGFGGRALKKDQVPKYLNSPENLIYHKSKVLYGLSHAKPYVKEEDRVVLVEGYFDVILPYQEGVKNVVATSGTALTVEQIRLLKRITSKVVTSFDKDEAGFEATKRAYSLCHEADMEMKVVMGSEVKDPADLVKAEGGSVFKEKIGASMDFIIFYIEKLIEDNDINTLEGRRYILSSILPLYKKMSPSERDFYVREFSGRMNMSEKTLYDEINTFELPKDHPARSGESEANVEAGKYSVEELIFGVLLRYPFLFEKAEKKGLIDFLDESLKDVYKALTDQYNSSRKELDEWDFSKGILSENKQKLTILSLYAEDYYDNFSEEVLAHELEKLIDRVKNDRRLRRLKQIEMGISEAESEQNKEKLLELLSEQQKLLSD